MTGSAPALARRPAFLRTHYDNFIGGQWVKPLLGRYFSDTSPLDQTQLAQTARSGAEDVEFALDAAHEAKEE